MTRPQARPEDGDRRPLPEKRTELDFQRHVTAEEMEQIALGYLPDEPRDTWFIYLDQMWLHCHRARTGTCVFKARFEAAEDGYAVVEAYANRDPRQYRSDDPHYDAALLEYLIERLLLERWAPLPMPEKMSRKHRDIHRKHVMGRSDDDPSRVDLNVLNNGVDS